MLRNCGPNITDPFGLLLEFSSNTIFESKLESNLRACSHSWMRVT
uniref:Uncharacterized protein n=1 Tax=Lotus japonicus TaxID=34305 RepID=I3SW25_LOTJA|nr:unknown [Lotus japonicus]